MCKCPNYIVWTGRMVPRVKRSKFKNPEQFGDESITRIDYSDKLYPEFKFVGHVKYDNMLGSSSWVQVPCGQCLECRIQQTRVWADRCVLEAKQYQHNYFITLTYDDINYPSNGSLSKREAQLFIKRLRKRFPDTKIRYLISGEYGDMTARCHYHGILFNCPLDDLTTTFKVKENGRLVNRDKPYKARDGLFYSDTIASAWQYKGMISVAHFNYDTAAYVSQYVTKKSNPKNKEQYIKLGIEPEFMLMSTHPGIGAQYFEDKDDLLYCNDHIIVASGGDSHRASVPRYFDKLFIKKYGDDVFQPIRNRRIQKKLVNQNVYYHSGRDYDKDCLDKDYHLTKLQKLKTSI